ncbi:MAG: hypothetical protein ACXACD_20590 [Candidatus Thorarchaeota archaeon]|jgi:hypothetical protein
MVDQMTLQTLGILFTGISLTVAAIYYTITIRNQNRTRQAQLLWSIYDNYRSIEHRRQSSEITRWEWEDLDDFFEKYGQMNNPEAWTLWTTKAAFFNGIGILLKNNLIDIKLLDDLLTNSVYRHWNTMRMGAVLVEWRKRIPNLRVEMGWISDSMYPDNVDGSTANTTFDGFDYLYHRLMESRAAHSTDQS